MFRYPVSVLDVDSFDEAELSRYDAIILPEASARITSLLAKVSGEAQETAARLSALMRHVFLYDRGNQLRVIEESGLSMTQCKALLELGGLGGPGLSGMWVPFGVAALLVVLVIGEVGQVLGAGHHLADLREYLAGDDVAYPQRVERLRAVLGREDRTFLARGDSSRARCTV